MCHDPQQAPSTKSIFVSTCPTMMDSRWLWCLLCCGGLQTVASFSPQLKKDYCLQSLKSHCSDKDDTQQMKQLSRRDIISSATAAASALSFLQIPTAFPSAVYAADDTKPVSISSSWSALAGLNKAESADFVSFDQSAYKAMRDDPSRTPLFQKALVDRLNAAPGGPKSQTVLDLGTGPFALFALLAAEAGAGKVYAIEADPEAARNARYMIKRSGFSDVITVLEGFSTDVTLPEKADVIVAEIVGSIASEEGAFATILDAHKRFAKEPNDPASWIPNRIQTYAAPASYTLHNMFKPPAFDWEKLSGEPVRFNCRDQGLQLLSDPVLVEDISFADISNAYQQAEKKIDLSFTVDGERLEDNEDNFFNNLRAGRMDAKEAAVVARETSRSFTGIAFWPRLTLDAAGTNIVNSRKYPDGGHQRSHWQTVLPIMSATPIGGLNSGDKITVTADFDLPDKPTKTAQYNLNGNVYPSSA